MVLHNRHQDPPIGNRSVWRDVIEMYLRRPASDGGHCLKVQKEQARKNFSPMANIGAIRNARILYLRGVGQNDGLRRERTGCTSFDLRKLWAMPKICDKWKVIIWRQLLHHLFMISVPRVIHKCKVIFLFTALASIYLLFFLSLTFESFQVLNHRGQTN